LDSAALELADFAAEFEVDHFTRYEHVDGVWVARRDFSFGSG